jgi:hypothetical protein
LTSFRMVFIAEVVHPEAPKLFESSLFALPTAVRCSCFRSEEWWV